MLDKRLNAFRPDLADMRLQGSVEAQQFREGAVMQMAAPIASLHRAPAFDAAQDTQVLMGEIVRVFDTADGWAWVQLQRDSYVGYVRREFLNTKIHLTSHRVKVPATMIYTKPSIKTQPVQFLAMNAEVSCKSVTDDFFELATGGFVFAKHFSATSHYQTDFVTVAAQFLHTQYYWGGKSHQGIDCSGLVQTALQACGITAPRDTDMQEKVLGRTIAQDTLIRGDLVFWAGHVGIMFDAENLLHANGHHMQVTCEPLNEVIARSEATGKPITSVKRL